MWIARPLSEARGCQRKDSDLPPHSNLQALAKQPILKGRKILYSRFGLPRSKEAARKVEVIFARGPTTPFDSASASEAAHLKRQENSLFYISGLPRSQKAARNDEEKIYILIIY